MNKNRRLKLDSALNYLNIARSIVESAMDEEADCLDNIPENLQASERYETMEENVSNMDCIVDTIDDAIEKFSELR